MTNLQQFINNISSPIFLLKNDKIFLFNNAFKNIFDEKNIRKIFNFEKIETEKKQIIKYKNHYYETIFSKFDGKDADYIIFVNQTDENKKKCEDVNSSLTKLLSIISHDLRTPFIQIMSLSNIITENYSNFSEKDLTKYINLLEQSSKNGYNLIDNLAEWGRIIRNKTPFEPIKFDISTKIKKAISLLKSNADAKNITIIYKEEALTIYADIDMFGKIMQNLLSNAIKFTHKGGKIVIKTKKIENDVQVSILDSGIGMHPKILDDLFLFHNTTKSKGTDNEIGTGLGLLLISEIIKKHNGKIWAESKLNEGSTFYFTLPQK